MNPLARNLAAEIGRFMPNHGWPARTAVLLLAATLAFFIFGLRPMEERRVLLEERLAAIAKHEPRADAKLLAVSTPSAKLGAFYDFFRRQGRIADHLAHLDAIAKRSGLELKLGDYRLTEAASLGLIEYGVSLPLSGNYAQIREFLERALAEIPVLTLDQVSVRRKRVADAVVDADVRLTIFLVKS